MSQSNLVRIAVYRILKTLQLRPFKRITVKLDPFHSNATAVRDVLYHLSAARVRETNPDCSLRTEVVCDGTPPSLELTQPNGERTIIRAANLTTLEILEVISGFAEPTQ